MKSIEVGTIIIEGDRRYKVTSVDQIVQKIRLAEVTDNGLAFGLAKGEIPIDKEIEALVKQNEDLQKELNHHKSYLNLDDTWGMKQHNRARVAEDEYKIQLDRWNELKVYLEESLSMTSLWIGEHEERKRLLEKMKELEEK